MPVSSVIYMNRIVFFVYHLYLYLYHRIVFVSWYPVCYIMLTRLDYSSALEYSIIKRYANIVYYYYYISAIGIIPNLYWKICRANLLNTFFLEWETIKLLKIILVGRL